MNDSGRPQANVLVPTVLEKTPNGERAMDLFSRLMGGTHRILWLPADVNSSSVQVLQASLLFLDSEPSDKAINFYINSPGGSVYDGNGLLDVMEMVKAPVHTYCVGLAASFGAVLLAAGAPGHRYVTKRSRVMIHEIRSQSGGGGTVTDQKINMDEMDLLNENLVRDIYGWLREDAPNRPESVDALREIMTRDTWMSAQEAIDMGLADNLIDQ